MEIEELEYNLNADLILISIFMFLNYLCLAKIINYFFSKEEFDFNNNSHIC